MRTFFIWIFGLTAFGFIGGIVGFIIDTRMPAFSGSNYGLGGIIAGLASFACVRLWLGQAHH